MPCAEKGGAITEYEEIWRKVEPNPKVGRAWILQSSMDGKCFMGRIGGCFIVLNEGKKGFGARREEWDGEGRRWGRKYGIGDLEGMPTFLGVRGLEFDGEEGWKVGGNVEVQGVGFVILALEEL
jgi:hypothetical protein